MKWALLIPFCLTLILGTSEELFAQKKSTVQLSAGNYMLYDLIVELSKQARFDFSAAAEILENQKPYTLSSGPYVLDQLLSELEKYYSFSSRWSRNHLHLYTPPKKEQPVAASIKLMLIDVETGLKLEGVNVIDNIQHINLHSNHLGIAWIYPPNPLIDLKLNFKLHGYQPKSMSIKPQDGSVHRILLRSLSSANEAEDMLRMPKREVQLNTMEISNEPLLASIDSGPLFYKDPVWRRLIPKRSKIEVDSLLRTRYFQAGLIPGIGLNGRHDRRTQVSGIALDLLVGLNAGVKGLAIGGFANISKYEVNGAQIAGAANLNGGSTRGIQLGGVYNATYMGMTGLQAAGVINTSKGVFRGVQCSGVMNNSHGSARGMQLTGVLNRAQGQLKGLQLSGIINSCDTLHGAQIGLLNKAKNILGFQLGIINVSEDSSGYFQIGLFNFNKGGHKFIAADYNEAGMAGIRFESGGRRWYSFINSGISLNNTHNYWEAGWGIGRKHRLHKFWNLHSALGVNALNAKSWSSDWNVLLRLNMDIRRNVWKGVSVYAGPSFNLLIPHERGFVYTAIEGNEISGWTRAQGAISWWPGFRLGIGF